MSPSQLLFNRLTAVEKSKLRAATPDGVLHLYQTIYRFEPSFYELTEEAGMKEMEQVLKLMADEYQLKGNPAWSGVTYKF
jgi:hypothetical protein